MSISWFLSLYPITQAASGAKEMANQDTKPKAHLSQPMQLAQVVSADVVGLQPQVKPQRFHEMLESIGMWNRQCTFSPGKEHNSAGTAITCSQKWQWSSSLKPEQWPFTELILPA